MLNREFCLECPSRPSEGKCAALAAKLALGNNYRPAECAIGPQVAAVHLREAADSRLGPLGIVYESEDVACGKEGPIEEPETRWYLNNELKSVSRGGHVTFRDPTVIAKYQRDPNLTPKEEDEIWGPYTF